VKRSGDGSGTGVAARGLAIALAFAAVACTERSITSPNEASAPGQGAETVEVALSPDSMASWRDTTFTGFAAPSGAGFWMATYLDSLMVRSLARVQAVPDTILLDSMKFAVDSFQDAKLRVVFDTIGFLAPSDGATFRVYALTRPYDQATATWQDAAAGEAWSTPGGDLGPVLTAFKLKTPGTDTIVNDTVVADIRLPADSLLQAWRADGGGDGILIVPNKVGTRVRFTQIVVTSHVTAVHADSAQTLLQYFAASAPTFIYDPPLPAVQRSELRVGGLPSSRGYFEFVPPDSAGGFQLRGAQISRAELVLRPLPPPPEAFRLERSVVAGLTGLGADFFQLGPKTPVVTLSGSTFLLDPNSLAAGEPEVLDITTLLRSWAATPADSTPPPLRFGVRFLPDGQALGYWSFGSGSAPASSQPLLRLFITPPVPFSVP
jgi:hypothetical protein